MGFYEHGDEPNISCIDQFSSSVLFEMDTTWRHIESQSMNLQQATTVSSNLSLLPCETYCDFRNKTELSAKWRAIKILINSFHCQLFNEAAKVGVAGVFCSIKKISVPYLTTITLHLFVSVFAAS